MHAPEIDGKVFINDYPEIDSDGAAPREGEFYRCRITAAHDYDLVAEIIWHIGQSCGPQRLIRNEVATSGKTGHAPYAITQNARANDLSNFAARSAKSR